MYALTQMLRTAKVKLSLYLIKHHAMKTFGELVVRVHRFLNLRSMWRGVVGFTLNTLYVRGKITPFSLHRSLDGLHIRSGRCEKEANRFTLLEIET
jgi:hypothetical protein